MRNSWYKKGLIVGIIVLFIFSSVVPVVFASHIKVLDTIEKQSTISRGNTLYVGGSGPNNYSSIQAAINDAEDGFTVFVYDDSSPYNEILVISKSINLIGENKENTVINSHNNDCTIDLNSDNVNISNFELRNGFGIIIKGHSSNSIIFNNNIFGHGSGIYLKSGSSDNIIDSNFISVGGKGIWFRSGSDKPCSKNTICNNIIDNCCSWGGIYFQFDDLGGSGGNIIKNNYLINCSIMIRGDCLSDYINEIDTSNTINQRPLYYYLNETNGFHHGNAGAIILVNCENFEIKNQKNSDFKLHIIVAHCTNTYVHNNTHFDIYCFIEGSYENVMENNSKIRFEIINSNNNRIVSNDIKEIDMWYGGYNTFSNNIIQNSSYNGFEIFDSSYNILEGNLFQNNERGLAIGGFETHSNIVRNNIFKQYWGEAISIDYLAYNTKIYHNNFYLSVDGGYVFDMGINRWYNVKLKEGNYWNDYTGFDDNNDGIGDSPYKFLVLKQDRYPLMTALGIQSNPPEKPNKPFGENNGAVGKKYRYTSSAVDPDDDMVRYCFDWGDGSTTWTGYYDSGETAEASHIWTEQGIFIINVKARDIYGYESERSNLLSITMPRQKEVSTSFLQFFQNHPNLFLILKQLFEKGWLKR